MGDLKREVRRRGEGQKVSGEENISQQDGQNGGRTEREKEQGKRYLD